MPGAHFDNVRLEAKVPNVHGGTTIVVLKGFENIEELRGYEFDAITLDEISSMRNFWIGLEEVLMPTLRMSSGPVLFIGSPKGFNHAYDLFRRAEEEKYNDWESFQFTSYDNPYISREEIAKMKQQLPEDRFAQEYLADFRKQEGLVYKEFNRKLHTFKEGEEPEYFPHIITGVDFGYTNPSAVIKIGIDKDNTFWILDEWYKTEQTTEAIIDAVKNTKANIVYPDPAEPDRIAMMRKHGINIRDVSKDVVAGVDYLRELFKQNKIRLASGLNNLILELETYAYPEKRVDKNAPETPVKENDHALDALRYALYSYRPTKKREPYVPHFIRNTRV